MESARSHRISMEAPKKDSLVVQTLGIVWGAVKELEINSQSKDIYQMANGSLNSKFLNSNPVVGPVLRPSEPTLQGSGVESLHLYVRALLLGLLRQPGACMEARHVCCAGDHAGAAL